MIDNEYEQHFQFEEQSVTKDSYLSASTTNTSFNSQDNILNGTSSNTTARSDSPTQTTNANG
jgi:hypothetical protein